MGPTSASITAAEVPNLLLAALASLREEWPEIEEENADPEKAGGRFGYLDAAWVVGHLADRMAVADTSEFDAVFDLIELLIKSGDGYVSELGVIGYVEGLQMRTVTSRGVDPESYWEAINEFWAYGTPIPHLEPDR